MSRIGFVTFADRPDMTQDDALVGPCLPAGMTLEPVPWDAPGPVEVAAPPLLVLRSCWNYHLEVDRFLAWLERCEREGARVVNPPLLVRWNVEKTYLRALDGAGCTVTPTRWLAAGDDADLAAVLTETGWDRAVVKPTVSASSFQTWTVDRVDAGRHDEALAAVLAHSGAMVQPFLNEIVDQGEWSLVFLGGAFSHAVLKRARTGDFRVQEEFGGTSTRLEPPPALVRDAQAVIEALPAEPVYARIDGVARAGRLLLVEAELIEPALFLGLDPEAPGRFAAALVTALAR